LRSWLGTEVGLREDFLEAEHLDAGGTGLVDERQMRLDHLVPNLFGTHGHIALQPHLDQSALELGHSKTPIQEDGSIKTQTGSSRK
jgi:hypothetical protein